MEYGWFLMDRVHVCVCTQLFSVYVQLGVAPKNYC